MALATFADTIRARHVSPFFYVERLPEPGRCQSCRRTERVLHVLRDWSDSATFEVCEECRLD